MATADRRSAAFDCLTLRAAGMAAATVADLGLSIPAPAGSLEEEVALLALVTRRPAVAREGQRLTVARPDGSVAALEPPTLPSDLVAGLDPPPRVAVFGGAWIGEEDEGYAEARAFGRRMGEAGIQVISGGYGGVMEAVSRGAAEAGGTAAGVAIAAWEGRVTPNPWLTHRIDAVDLFARYPVMADAEAWVAFPGGVGTLAEVAVCWNLTQMSIEPRPLLLVGPRWERLADALRRDLIVTNAEDLELVRTATGEEAARSVTERITVGGV